jgi:DNA-binding MarR family transcriptional regulator
MLRAVDHLQDELGVELARHARLLHVVRSRMATKAPPGLDVAAMGLLMMLVRCGPRRQGELAETALLDPSTASRYVTQLARAGLLERRPDPDDGRAVQLVASTVGEQLAGELAAHRQEVVREMLSGWTDADLGTLLTLVRRLNDSLEHLRPTHHRQTQPTHNPPNEQEH